MAPEGAVGVNDIDGIFSFLKHIDWTEPWLVALSCFHAVCIVVTILSRKFINIQIVFFLALLLLIYMSENINEYAAMNYKKFAKQQYFDANGLFIAIIFSFPLLCNCLLMVMIWIYQTAHLLVKVKRAEIRQKSRADEAKDK